MTGDGGGLRFALSRLAPEHALVARLTPGFGASAVTHCDVAIEPEAGAVRVTATVIGPGASSARWLDITIEGSDLRLGTMTGGRFGCTFPPAAFQPIVRAITPGFPIPPSRGGGHDIEIGSLFGRSSDGDLPYFYLSDSSQVGLWFAVRHSGYWRAKLTKLPDRQAHRLTVWGTGSDIDLEAGEILRMPSVVVGPFDGDGWAAVRAHIDVVAPPRIPPPISYNTWFNQNGDVDAQSCLATVPVAAEVGVEYFVVDAGYYGGAGSTFDGPGLGTFEPDLTRFPHGLGAVGDAVHAAGLGFGLWFEPERAHPESGVAREFPTAMRSAPGKVHHLVDFGDPAIRDWAFDLITARIDEYSLDLVKWDFNIDNPLAYWADDERGALAHDRGVHEVIDRIRQRHPRLVWEHVSSGGNRLDLEFMSRSDYSVLSDQVQSPDIVRSHLGGASLVFPARHRCTGVSPQVVWHAGRAIPAPALDPAYPRVSLLSTFAGAFGIYEPLATWQPETISLVREHIAMFKRYRHLLDGNYRRFLEGSVDGRFGWEAWEFSSREAGRAILVAFRHESQATRLQVTGAVEWEISDFSASSVLVERSL